jgi:hypothetical protein
MNERRLETTAERRARYLRLAREAKELASRSKTVQMREACLAMAQSWLALASDLDDAREDDTAWADTTLPPDVPQVLAETGPVSYEQSPHGD